MTLAIMAAGVTSLVMGILKEAAVDEHGGGGGEGVEDVGGGGGGGGDNDGSRVECIFAKSMASKEATTEVAVRNQSSTLNEKQKVKHRRRRKRR